MSELLKEIKEMQNSAKTLVKYLKNGKTIIYMGFENDEDGAKLKKYNKLVAEYKRLLEEK